MALPAFPWFQLPRELRNKTYPLITCTIYRAFEDYRFPGPHVAVTRECIKLESMPCLSLQLVSRQFAREYMEELAVDKEQASVSVSMREADKILGMHAGCTRASLLSQLARVYHFDLQFYRFDTSVYRDDDVSLPLRNLLAVLPSLKSITGHCLLPMPLLDQCMSTPGLGRTLLSTEPLREWIINLLPEPAAIKIETASFVVGQSFALPNQAEKPYSWKPYLREGSPGGATLGNHPKNRVTYRATPSTAPDAVAGLQLQLIAEASYTLKDVENDMRATLEENLPIYVTLCGGPVLRKQGIGAWV